MELSVFGPIVAQGPAGPIEFTRTKERAVLAALALSHGRVVSTDQLADALWPDSPPVRPHKALQVHIWRVRAALGAGVVETCSDGYALAPGVVVDAELFETEANAGDSAEDLRAALARWRGDPYVDLGEWVPAELERTRLVELRDRALETCLELEIQAGTETRCIAELEAMVKDKPLRERRWFLLMTALSRDGRTADALRAYQRARKVFAAELGIDPGPELRILEEQILLADVREPSHGKLPRQLTSFVGRQSEVAQLADMVRERSIVTLTGIGGVGKTRLALAVAASINSDFRDGAWLCELAALVDADALWETIAASLEVRPPPGRNLQDVVLKYLAVKRLLLVLDNCEHLLSAVNRAACAITENCPGVALLATSRERLAVPGERVLVVSPLPVPPTDSTVNVLKQSDAVRLYCARAHDVDDAFELTDHNSTAVAQLCQHLDGLPLSIELAAARARSLSPGDLVARIDDRFRLLTGGTSSIRKRHQTLRNTIDWSYDMLSETEQHALNCMSVFANGCDLASAEAVLGAGDVARPDVVGLLSELVDKSLVDVDVTDGSGRYRLLETIRQYARERLEAAGESVRVRDRHLARYVSLAEEAGPHLRGRGVLEWGAVIARETDNFRAALDWAVEAKLADQGLRLVVPLSHTGTLMGWFSTDWLETAISIPGASQDRLYPLATALTAIGAAIRLELDRAATLVLLAQDAQTRLDTSYFQVHSAAGVLALVQGKFDQAQRHARVCVDLARAIQDPFEIASSLCFYAVTILPESPGHAMVSRRQGESPPEAVVIAEDAVTVARNAQIPSILLHALIILVSIIDEEQPSRARALLDEAADLARKLGDRWGIATAVASQAGIALVQEDWPTALLASTESVEADFQLGGSWQLCATFILASIALAQLQLLEAAAVLIGFIDARFPPPAVDQALQAQFAAARQRMVDTLGATRTEELEAHGATLTIADAVTYLRSECNQLGGR